MDQVFSFGVYDKSLQIGKMSFTIIGLSLKGGFNQGYLFSNCTVKGRRKGGGSRRTENFNGAFRIIRTGKTISTLYKKTETPEWTKVNTFGATDEDMLIGVQVRNFFGNRTTIQANDSISAVFDSLKINAAQKIIEEEI